MAYNMKNNFKTSQKKSFFSKYELAFICILVMGLLLTYAYAGISFIKGSFADNRSIVINIDDEKITLGSLHDINQQDIEKEIN